MSGGKQTYLEGHIANHGSKTVTGITVQVVFANDVHMAPQIETGPLNMIYMREPYMDTRPVSASPLAPGAEADFRLIFDDISGNWNQQLPRFGSSSRDPLTLSVSQRVIRSSLRKKNLPTANPLWTDRAYLHQRNTAARFGVSVRSAPPGSPKERITADWPPAMGAFFCALRADARPLLPRESRAAFPASA